MILSCSNITKTFNGNTILDHVSFHIEEHARCSIVGINGAGKSTLLKIIIGEMNPDEGDVTVQHGKTVGYLAQHQDLDDTTPIYECLMEVKQPILEMERRLRALEHRMTETEGDDLQKVMDDYSRLDHEYELANGYAWQSEITGVLKGLGFAEEEFRRPVCELSGGQKTRVSLGKLLLSKPDIIMLDEPTNHLDMNSIAWLETYLLNYAGTVIIVAHDRYFLDRVSTQIVEIDHGKAMSFPGNYTEYSKKKAIVRAGIIRAYMNQQAEIKHQEAVIAKLRSFNREKSIKRADSREKMLDKMELLEKPEEDSAEMHFTLEPSVASGKDVLTVTGLEKGFDGDILFRDVNFEIHRGERVAIIGNNGTGKSTLLKLIIGQLLPDSGEIRRGTKVNIGYYDQEHQVLDMDKTIFQEISDEHPDMNNTEIRNVLAAFLFTGEDVFKRIGSLSGGERGRVSLAKLMLSEANFLILDEPTNHLDIASKEILENALNRYTGTVLCVSHDRYFINQTATRVLDLTMGSLLNYIGNYDYYLEKKEDTEKAFLEKISRKPSSGKTGDLSSPERDAGTVFGSIGQKNAAAGRSDSAGKEVSDGKLSWQQQKEEQARIRKIQNDLKKTEKEIHELETRSEEIDGILSQTDIYSDVAKLMKLNREKEEITAKLEPLYEKWEELAEME
ncbi:ribosomal protection-like ABC-F family protein [[Clostridium] aminophilum]|uniref:ribosomal protection-like ABC-F family protein n=1 Tax=[Clostridium] aminophilum TaxID=1526 RepID=UPI00331F051D